MDFENLNADVNMILNKHFTRGRGGYGIEFIVIHYNAGDLTVEGCYNVWQTRDASAHYQVESSGRIGQLVWDRDMAWHASNGTANRKSIGIEHANRGNTMTDACIENGAHLCAAICKYYKLGRPEWLKNVFPHCYFAATSCPGPLKEGTNYHERYMARAQYWYDVMTGAIEEEDEVTNEDIEKIAQRVWEIEQGKITANRVYRMTSMLKAMCGLGADDMSDPMDKHDGIRDQTISRWERTLRILKGMVGIDQEDISKDAIKTPMSVHLSDEQMEKIADMVVERLSVKKDE